MHTSVIYHKMIQNPNGEILRESLRVVLPLCSEKSSSCGIL